MSIDDVKQNDDEFYVNPELYAKLAQPYPTRGAADEAMLGFLHAVMELREEFGIAELMVLCGNHFTPETPAPGVKPDAETTSCRALALGHPDFRPEFGAMAYKQYTQPEVIKAARWLNIAGVGK